MISYWIHFYRYSYIYNYIYIYKESFWGPFVVCYISPNTQDVFQFVKFEIARSTAMKCSMALSGNGIYMGLYWVNRCSHRGYNWVSKWYTPQL